MAYDDQKGYKEFWEWRGIAMPASDHSSLMEFGKEQGWWEEFDHIGPIRRWYIDVKKFATWAHLLADLKFFPSVAQARKAGHGKPVVIGEFKMFKGREKFIIED